MGTVPTPLDWAANAGLTPTAAAFQAGVGDPLDYLLDPPQAMAYANSAQTPANNAVVPISLDTEQYDNDNMHSIVSGTQRFTINTAGTYEVFAQICYSANGTGNREIRILKNGGTPPNGRVQQPASAGAVTTVQIIGVLIPCVVGDTLDLNGIQNSGAGLALQVGSGINSFMRVKWVAP